MYAAVLLSKVSRDLDKVYHYSIPAILSGKLRVGQQVSVPFGRRVELGYVVGLLPNAEVSKVKDIIAATSEKIFFSEKGVALARWIADYYFSFFISALRLVMPPGTAARESRWQKPVSRQPKKDDRFSTDGSQLTVSKTTVPLSPTPEQARAIETIRLAIDEQKTGKFLLYGVTGSGKTEVYLQTIAHLLEKGKGAIVLVPEISLTPQLVQRFRDRFHDRSAVIHSEISEKSRREEWDRIASGQAAIVLGTRSALFAPVKELGMIVIDEEYENTYKSDKSPRYHAREVALKLAELNNAVVVMGSATPAVETFYKAEQGEYQKLALTKRIDDRVLPPVEVIDMRKEKEWLLSRRLREELKETLSRGEQAILFINRRGFFTFALCKECGLTLTCPHCSVSLAYYSSEAKLRCGRCGYAMEASIFCPNCNSSSIRYFGTGTQRIEKEVADVYPAARILRYDRDSVSKRDSHASFFATFAEGKADVLIGTQMVTKGLDIANVTLVGVVSADTGINLPDFRSSEHTFQLLTQVAGRAGRHHLPGRVIIQTYCPEHYVIQAAAKHDYETFYHQEIGLRQELGYPPFNHLINLIFSGKDEKQASAAAEAVGRWLGDKIGGEILGPAPAAISRLRGEWRYQLLIKVKEPEAMLKLIAEALEQALLPGEVKTVVDVDPMSTL
jgi:primosomal protein N' (replication factor Y)